MLTNPYQGLVLLLLSAILARVSGTEGPDAEYRHMALAQMGQEAARSGHIAGNQHDAMSDRAQATKRLAASSPNQGTEHG